jgi:hypothetical protein
MEENGEAKSPALCAARAVVVSYALILVSER